MRRVAALAAALVLNGCWLQIGNGPGHTRFVPDSGGLDRSNVATLHELWSVPLGSGLVGEPIVSGGNVYVTIPGDRVTAYEASTGDHVWSVSPASGWGAVRNTTPAVVVGDEIWTGGVVVHPTPPPFDCDSGAIRVNARTGEVTWNDRGPIPGTAVVSADLVVQHVTDFCGISDDGQGLLVRDAETLAVLWRAETGEIPPPTPTVTSEDIFVFSRTSLRRYPAAGCGSSGCPATWTKTFADDLQDRLVVAGDDGIAYVIAEGDLVAIEGATGAELWRASNDWTGANLALAHGVVYTGANDAQGGHLHAYAADGCGAVTCAPLWSASTGTGAGAPTVAGDLVYIGGSNGLMAFATEGCGAATCAPFATVPLSNSPGHISISGGRIYATSGNLLMVLAPD